MLKPIKPKRISDQVFDQLRDLIFRGSLKAGEQLMTERELAESLGVSRPTVREAINKLVAMRLLEHRQGQGTFVKSPGSKSDRNLFAALMDNQDASLQELLEVRLGLECNAVALAAQRATEEDIRELELRLSQMRKEIEEGGLGNDADVSFHMAIAFASKNTVQIHIMKSLYDLLFFGIKEYLIHLYADPQNLDAVIGQHRIIVDSIRRRDSRAASDAMRTHIGFVLDFLKSLTLA